MNTNGQADAAARRAAEAAQWRNEVTDELSLYKRYGDEPLATVGGWVQNLRQDIEAKQADLWKDTVELHRLIALLRTLQAQPVDTP